MIGRPQMSRPVAITAADHFAAMGLRPLLASDEHKIIGGIGAPLQVLANITDNAVVATDLRVASLWDVRVQQFFGSGATPIRGMLHIEGLALYVNGQAYQTETPALKADLDNRAYITVSANGVTQKLPLRGRILDAWSMIDFKQAAAAAETRVLHRGLGPLWLERPFQIDLETDTFSFNVDSAINWVSGDIPAYLLVYGAVMPKTVAGSEVTHATASSYASGNLDAGGASTVVGPLQQAQVSSAFLSRVLGYNQAGI